VTGHQETLLRLFAPQGRADPYPHYATLLAEAPVLAIGDRRVLVTGYREAVKVLTDFRMFPVPDHEYADRLWPTWRQIPSTEALYDSLLFRNPPENQPVRHLVGRFFAPRRVALMRPMIERIAESAITELLAGPGLTDGTRSFTTIPDSVLAELLGIAATDMARLVRWLDLFLERNELHPPDKRIERTETATTHLADYVRDHLLARRAATSLIGSLARLDERSLVSTLLFLLGAGTVTTASLLGSGLLRLTEDSGLLRRLRADDALVRSFVLETLRHDPPVQYGVRVAAGDTELDGVPLRRDSLVLVCIGALGRDPRQFTEPEIFRADRFALSTSDTRRILSFGLGAHRCAGVELALVTGEIAFRLLARRAATLTPAGPPRRQNRAVVRKFTSLNLHAQPVRR
jgi:cytochrome P450